MTFPCRVPLVTQERHLCQYTLKSSLPLSRGMQQWDVPLQILCVRTEISEHPLEGSGWQSSCAPSSTLRQPGTAPRAYKSTCLSTARLLVTAELAQPVIELLRGHLQRAMPGALTIVDPAPVIQGQSCNLRRLLRPLLQWSCM